MAKRKPVARQRFQLVVGLGEGPRGAERRQQLEKAASLVHQKVTVWARHVLLSMAGLREETPVTRAEFDALDERREVSRQRPFVSVGVASQCSSFGRSLGGRGSAT